MDAKRPNIEYLSDAALEKGMQGAQAIYDIDYGTENDYADGDATVRGDENLFDSEDEALDDTLGESFNDPDPFFDEFISPHPSPAAPRCLGRVRTLSGDAFSGRRGQESFPFALR